MHQLLEDRDQEGFTLLEMIVTVCISRPLTMLIFNLFHTTIKTQEFVTDQSNRATAVYFPQRALEEAIRLSPEVRTNEDGSKLFVLGLENTYSTWSAGNGKLTNGSRSFANIEDARFEVEGGLVSITLTPKTGAPFTFSSGSRFEPHKPVLTDEVLRANGSL